MIALACDHGGYNLMREVIKHLSGQKEEFVFFGTHSEESCDYPVYAEQAAKAVAANECVFAILICGTGIGMSIAANKFRGIRAAVCGDTFSTEMTRRHNNANVLCLGARVTGDGLALKIVDTFLKTPFDGKEGRHGKRVAMIAKFEEKM